MTASPLDYQRAYFKREPTGNTRLQPTDSPYVDRHFRRTWDALALPPGCRIVEVGAGLGRFTGRLAAAGATVTATDLSDELLAQARARLPGLQTAACDMADLPAHVKGMDGAVGFFMLHHLHDLPRAFAGLRGALRTGARVAFCEPNAYCALYYVQIALSRHMTFEGDGGVANMRPRLLTRCLEGAGFRDVAIERYGFTPPAIYNRTLGEKLDRALERLSPLEPVRAFQIVSATAC